MENFVPIRELKKAVIVFKEKGNEIIKRYNIPWKVKMPDENNLWGTPVVSYSEKEIVVDLSRINVIRATACDENGNQRKGVFLGYWEDEQVELPPP